MSMLHYHNCAIFILDFLKGFVLKWFRILMICAVQRVMPSDSVSVHRNLHAACWCCALWHGKPRHKATMTLLHSLKCQWCIHRKLCGEAWPHTHTHREAFQQGLLSSTQIALFIAHNQSSNKKQGPEAVKSSVSCIPMLLAYVCHAFYSLWHFCLLAHQRKYSPQMPLAHYKATPFHMAWSQTIKRCQSIYQ